MVEDKEESVLILSHIAECAVLLGKYCDYFSFELVVTASFFKLGADCVWCIF